VRRIFYVGQSQHYDRHNGPGIMRLKTHYTACRTFARSAGLLRYHWNLCLYRSASASGTSKPRYVQRIDKALAKWGHGRHLQLAIYMPKTNDYNYISSTTKT
jgi:hypothetical protein